MIRVLVVDDEEKTRGLIKLLIDKALGISITWEATNGEEALGIIKGKCPDIVITDIKMPVLDGLELTQRALAYNPDLIIIMISAYEEFEYAKKAIKLGVSDYLLKPIKRSELNEALEKGIDRIKERKMKYGINEGDSKSKTLIQQVLIHIKNNLTDQDLSLSTVAAQFFVNSSYLSRLFKAEVGESFIEYVTKVRIERAIWYLENTDKKAYEIAELVGVVDATYFGKCFKKNKGVSINEYKKILRDCKKKYE